jgi:hypothetical protein
VAKTAVRKRAPRTPARRRQDEFPYIATIVGAVFGVVLIGLFVASRVLAGSDPTAAVDGIPCDQLEQTATHYHASLTILYDGQPVNVNGNVGRPTTCFYWLHTHDETPGIIHVESPKNGRTYTLGNFFDIWRQPLSHSQVATMSVDNKQGQRLFVFVDGKAYTGDPRQIQIKSHEVITLEIGKTSVPPPPYTFANGL